MHFNFNNNQFSEINTDLNKPAIVADEVILSWKALYERVTDLEKVLAEINLSVGDSVIVYGHKEILFPIAALTLIKNNITYIPVDSVYPSERVKQIMEQTGCNVIINCSETDFNIGQQFTINADLRVTKHHNTKLKSKIESSVTNPIRYIIFTSGSSGEPKGVQITKDNIEAFINWIETDYNFTSETLFIAQASFSFDISFYDIFGTFRFGGTMILISKQLSSDLINFTNHIKNHGGTTIITTPSFIYRLLRHHNFNGEFLSELKQFLLIGEELKYSIIQSLMNLFPDCQVINAYGPTEATIATTMHIFTKDNYQLYYDKVPIGTSITSGRAFLENVEATKENPSEIILEGSHVSIGYLNNPEKTNEKFYTKEGKRGFRTGDLGYKKDDILYCCGRMDDMIKMHGYRIELGEISKHITNIEYIEQAETIPVIYKGEVKRILSFVIPKINYKILKENIIKEIVKKIPEYMIPGDIIILDKFPINNSGKTDKKQLLEIYRNM